MSRRSSAIVLGVLLLLMIVAAVVRSPVPFVARSPGLTLDVLAGGEEEPVVTVEDRPTYPTSGSLRLVTVSETTPQHEVLLLEALHAWWRPSFDLIPREVLYSEETTDDEERALSAAQMVSSQDTAVAAALTELGHDLDSYPLVAGVTPGGPSEDKLEVRDRILSIGGIATADVEEVFDAVGELQPGEETVVVVRRKGERRAVRVETTRNPDDPDRALLGIFPGTGYRFPFDVTLAIDERIVGPSAGLVFALAVHDALTPGPMTGGEDVAATGIMDADGVVGDIGSVRQKIAGARRDGATLFLLPPGNCDAVVGASLDADMAVVPVADLGEAIDAVRTHAKDPDADLPRCDDES